MTCPWPVGLRKGDSQQMEQVNKVLAGISQEERVKLMDHIIAIQPADKTDEAKKETSLVR